MGGHPVLVGLACKPGEFVVLFGVDEPGGVGDVDGYIFLDHIIFDGDAKEVEEGFEVGMGGAWDATNIIQPAVTVLTPIGMDHMEYLGNSLEEIASTKAGILKPDAFAVLSNQEATAAKVLLARAVQLGMNLGTDIAREGIEYEVIARQIAVGGQLISIRGTKDVYSDLFLPLLS